MTASAARRVESRSTPAGRDPADLVHALAQLPDSVTLWVGSAEQDSLRLLARAYGVEDRIELRGGRDQWRFDGAADPDPAATTMAELVESLWPEDAEPAATERGDACLRGHRIAVVTNVPTHYRVPLFNGLARRVARAGASLRIFFMDQPPVAQPWLAASEQPAFEHEFVPSARLPKGGPWSSKVDRVRPPHVPRGLARRLAEFEPSILVGGSFSFAGIAACAYARRKRIPFGLWSGDVAHQQHNRSFPALRRRQRAWLARRADFGIGYGWLATCYLNDLAPGLPSVIARNTSVLNTGEPRRALDADPLKLLAVADLTVPEKGFEVVVEAMRLLRDQPYELRVIGNPPRDTELRRAVVQDPRIDVLGPLPHEQVRTAFAENDVFVFPSRMDIFGLALPEAMAAGLPVVSSKIPGSVSDLVVGGRNALIAEARDPSSWARAVGELRSSPALRDLLGESARSTIRRRWTMAHAVEGTLAGFRLGALRTEGAR